MGKLWALPCYFVANLAARAGVATQASSQVSGMHQMTVKMMLLARMQITGPIFIKVTGHEFFV